MSKQYFLNRQVIIVPYDKNWQLMFEKEQKKILAVIAKYDVIVEHIGSTAIKAMAAKPILDIMIGTKDLTIADICINPLQTIDYEYVPDLEKNFPNRRFLHKGPNLPNKHVHIHMVKRGSDFWHKHLSFRNYLRQNHNAAIEYLKLKEKLAKKYKTDVASYTEAKTAFIQNIIKLAR